MVKDMLLPGVGACAVSTQAGIHMAASGPRRYQPKRRRGEYVSGTYFTQESAADRAV